LVASDDGCDNDPINNKLNLLLTYIERVDKNVLNLNQLVDMLISKETITEMSLSGVNADYVNTREIDYVQHYVHNLFKLLMNIYIILMVSDTSCIAKPRSFKIP
jgi:phosphatidylinositol kinase/protein kinase (PI-3  family)